MAEKMKNLIRIAQKSDHSFIVESQLQMAEETENLKLHRETLSLGVTAVLENPSKGQYYIADVDGIPRAMLLTIPEWSDWRNGTVLWIHSLYVQKEFRKLGLFKSLYLYLKNKVFSSSNLRGLRLYVDKRNVNAQVVYKNLGMDNEHYELYEWFK